MWSNADHALYLARDHAGTRSIYYEAAQGRVRWSTYLDTFFTDAPAREIDEVYAANFLAGIPAGVRTPYESIRAVPAAHFICIEGESVQRRQYWTCWNRREEIRYPSEEACQEHFLARFKTAIERRTKGETCVAAQLSGGMDSSSIVCMSDVVRREAGSGISDLINTISHYDDSEAGWDERPFFTAVEEARGKRGMHLKTSFTDRTFNVVPKSAGRYMWPGADSSAIAQEESLLRLCLDQELVPCCQGWAAMSCWAEFRRGRRNSQISWSKGNSQPFVHALSSGACRRIHRSSTRSPKPPGRHGLLPTWIISQL